MPKLYYFRCALVTLYSAGTESAILACGVPRKSFRHYTRISEAEAFARFPELICPALAQRASA